MTKKQKIDSILEFAEELFPNAKCELNYSKDYELVIAVMLSAQTTDAAVNKVTPILFSIFKTLEDLANANISDVENCIREIGLYKNKARNVIGIARTLLDTYNGKVPSDKNELQKLPGVGNKTAGVVRAEIFNIPDLPVDTHIMRISKRFNLSSDNENPYVIEQKLKRYVPEENWIKAHHRLIHFGRYFCTAKNPNCTTCKIKDFCNKN